MTAEDIAVHQGSFRLGPLSFSLRSGELTGLVGRNGAGKTTLMAAIVGLRSATGRIEGSGRRAGRRLNSSFVPEEPMLFDHLTVAEHLRFVELAIRERSKERSSALVERLALGPHLDKTARHLSLGLKRRTALAMGLLKRSDLLLLDEPLNGLDPEGQLEVRAILLELVGEGQCILVSSHWLPELERVAGNFLLLDDGQQRASGSIDELRRQAHLEEPASLEDVYFKLAGTDRL